jgi:hypothetical protein
MRTKKLNETELKRIAQSIEEQEKQVNELLNPKVIIENEEEMEAEKIVSYN